nr:hypothetical protein 15 [Legionellales bacterium]
MDLREEIERITLDVLREQSTPAEKDFAAAKSIRRNLEKLISDIDAAFRLVDKKVSHFNSPGVRSALKKAIKRGFDSALPYGFAGAAAKKELGKYYESD